MEEFAIQGTLRAIARSRVHDTEGQVAVTGRARISREGSLRVESLEVEADLATLRTGDTLKDLEVRRRLGDRTGGRATLVLTEPAVVESGRAQIAGTLTFRGIARPLRATAEIDPGSPPRGRASFQVRFTDHGLEPPKLLFLKIEDAVDVRVELAGSGPKPGA